MIPRIVFLVLAGTTLFAGTPSCAVASEQKAKSSVSRGAFFEKHIRPLLLRRCVRCHGPRKQKNALRLDSRAALLKGGRTGPAIVPGEPEKSLLLQAVRYSGDLQMPPSRKLRDEEIRHLAIWIKAGAHWPREPGTIATITTARQMEQARKAHWAFWPIHKPKVPVVRTARRIVSPVDCFVLKRLEDAGLTLSPPAGRRTLIRRAHHDLLGLPPTDSEVQQFEKDPSPNAFAHLVDRLLARKEYGQHWARHWLDVARYADTTGYQEGAEPRFPFSYTYRDYVVRSFNEDTPFHQFVLEQLAGDQLDLNKHQRWKLAGMGFLTLGPRFNYNRHDIIDDQIDVVTRGLLGLTVTCARCHDHKYDPILSADYYGLYGVFASSYEPWNSDLPRIGEAAHENFERYRRFRGVLRKRTNNLKNFYTAMHRKIQHEMRAYAGEYLWYLVQQMPEHRTQAQVSLDTKRVHLRGPTPYGPGAIVRWQHFITSRGETDPVFGLWNQLARLKRKQFAERARAIIGKATSGNPAILRALRKNPPQSMVDVARRYANLLESVYRRWNRLKKIDSDAKRFLDPADEQLRQVLYANDSPVAMNVDEAREAYTDGEFNRYMGLKRKLDSAFLEYRDVAAPRAMILKDRDEPVEPRIFIRGKSTRPGRFIPKRNVRLLSHVNDGKPFQHGSGRLELARAIIHPKNPLTARVIVNRVWGWHLGRGLVETPSDLGTRGSSPSHPQLLDWLASTFMETGWSIKKLHRTIMLSAVYQQQSLDREKAQRRDPRNRLLWRMNRRRLQFEEVRDSLLKVANKLDTRLAGPPTDRFSSSRRSLYLLVNRQHLPTVRRVFDFPSPDISAASRPQTTIPQQSLYWMNNQFVNSIADTLAEQLKHEVNSVDQRVTWIYRKLFHRDASTDEKNLARAFLSPERNEKDEMNLWRQYIHVLLMSNEFLFVD